MNSWISFAGDVASQTASYAWNGLSYGAKASGEKIMNVASHVLCKEQGLTYLVQRDFLAAAESLRINNIPKTVDSVLSSLKNVPSIFGNIKSIGISVPENLKSSLTRENLEQVRETILNMNEEQFNQTVVDSAGVVVAGSISLYSFKKMISALLEEPQIIVEQDMQIKKNDFLNNKISNITQTRGNYRLTRAAFWATLMVLSGLSAVSSAGYLVKDVTGEKGS